MQEEIWKDILGWEGLYQVSNMGNIKSMPKTWWHGLNRHMSSTKPETIMKQIIGHRGYLLIHLLKNGFKKRFHTHLLVASHFLVKPDPEFTVNHIDGNKLNNAVSNLEYISRGDNTRHAVRMGLNKGRQKINFKS